MQDIVQKLLDEALEERSDLFLLDLSISLDNSIKVVIDGDNGVLVEDCMYVSRAIEHNLDRDEHDFSLEVLSAGAAAPLKMPRQYTKHVGRNLQVKTEQGESFEGQLKSVEDDAILLTWKTREPKPVGKGKITVTKEQVIAFVDIKEAIVKIKF
jgi:ribosome maturation factor RimP